MLLNTLSLGPVSYTHLDVYKRQGHQDEYGEKHRLEPVETARRLADKFSRRTPRTNAENIAAVFLQVIGDVDGIKADRRVEESKSDDHNRVDDVVERVLVEVDVYKRQILSSFGICSSDDFLILCTGCARLFPRTNHMTDECISVSYTHLFARVSVVVTFP